MLGAGSQRRKADPAALGVDLIALAVAVVREFRTDPWAASGKTADAIKRIADALLSFVPWRTK